MIQTPIENSRARKSMFGSFKGSPPCLCRMDPKFLTLHCVKHLTWVLDDIKVIRENQIPSIQKQKRIDELYKELLGTFELCLKGVK